ncbi:hypothetical protein ACE1ET_00760 [Saccharicrinis sp. FJH62]|uniref:hypothetical protein n=1 Tax=Saccharicrinis sp. FJH62 TaxID=3344657 RepID=UPI0035D500CF
MRTSVILIILILSINRLNAQPGKLLVADKIDKKQNTVYLAHDFFLTISMNYERLFLPENKSSFAIRGGLGRDYGNKCFAAIAEGIFLYGKSKHFFEAGIGYHQPFLYAEEGPDPPVLSIMAGYRYQSKKGFMFKIYPEFLPAIFPDPDTWGSLPFIGFAFGYSFK